MNADYPAKKWELGAPKPQRRFEAASKLRDRGWIIRFRLDPMIPYETEEESWRDGYSRTIDRINKLEPQMVTIGALRASSRGLASAAAKNNRPIDLFDFLSEKDPSGFKYRVPFDTQVEMYQFALTRLDQSRITPALCKEDVSVWKAIGLRFDGCHCLHKGRELPDEIVSLRGFSGTLPD